MKKCSRSIKSILKSRRDEMIIVTKSETEAEPRRGDIILIQPLK